jgi:hypothetical protein
MGSQTRVQGVVMGFLGAVVGSAIILHFVALPNAGAAEEAKQTLDEITVKRINVVDESGKVRMVLSNSDRFPNPILKGKEYPRSIKPAGLVFYKPNGDEAGGIALVEVNGIVKNFMAFDYSNSEAFGMGITETAKGEYGSGLTVLDRVPLDADIEKVGSVGTERIAISNDDGTARVSVNDAKGKVRIRLAVDQDGNAKIEIKDADGKVVFTAPP